MGAAMPTIPESGFNDGNGVHEFTQFTQQQMAALVRSGLDLDMVLNPFQMKRLSTTAEDRPPPELAQVKSVRNPIHIEPKSLTVVRDGGGYALSFTHTSSVPSYLTVHFMTIEMPDETGCPQFYPMSNLESMYSRHQVLIQPQARQTITFPIPDVVVHSIIAPSRLPPHSLPYLASADVNPSFQHAVIILEPIEAMQRPDLQLSPRRSRQRNSNGSEAMRFGDEDDPEQASPRSEVPNSPSAREIPLVQRVRGFCTAEWLYIRLQPVASNQAATSTTNTTGSGSGGASSSGVSTPANTSSAALPRSSSGDMMGTNPRAEQELSGVAVHDGSFSPSGVQKPGPESSQNSTESQTATPATSPSNNCAVGVRSVRQSVLASRALYDLHEIFGLDAARAADSESTQRTATVDESKAPRAATSNQPVVTHVTLSNLGNRRVKLEWDPRDARDAMLPVVPDCVICLTSPSDCVNLPCRHLCVCLPCAERLIRQPIDQAKCPICRERLVSITKLETVAEAQ